MWDGKFDLTQKGERKAHKTKQQNPGFNLRELSTYHPPTLGIYHLVWIDAGLCPVHDTWILGKQILLEVNLAQLSHPSVQYNAAIKSNELDLYTPKQTFK